MNSLALSILVAAAFIAIGVLIRVLTRTRAQDVSEINAFASKNGFAIGEIKRTTNYWRYWTKGNLSISNLSRVFVVSGKLGDGRRAEYHLVFDAFTRASEPRVIEQHVE